MTNEISMVIWRWLGFYHCNKWVSKCREQHTHPNNTRKTCFNQLNDTGIVTEMHPAYTFSCGYFTLTTYIRSHIHMQIITTKVSYLITSAGSSYKCVTLLALILVNVVEIGSTSSPTRQDVWSETLRLWHKSITLIVALSRIRTNKFRGFELLTSGSRACLVSPVCASGMFVSQRLLQQQWYLLGSPVDVRTELFLSIYLEEVLVRVCVGVFAQVCTRAYVWVYLRDGFKYLSTWVLVHSSNTSYNNNKLYLI